MEGRTSGREKYSRVTRERRGEASRGEERKGNQRRAEENRGLHTLIIHTENTETNTLHSKASFVFPSSTVSVVQQQYHQKRMTNIETNITNAYQNLRI